MGVRSTLGRPIVETLEEAVVYYRHSAVPIVVFQDGNRVIARVASSEFHVVIAPVDETSVVINFECKPQFRLEEGHGFKVSDVDRICKEVKRVYLNYIHRLAEMRVYPFCGAGFQR